MPELVLVETAAGVRRITMHRPEARNALSSALMAELAAAFVAAEEAEEVDVVVFTGTDPAFCAGLDLRELGQGGANLRGGADAAASSPFAALWRMTKPVIGAVNMDQVCVDLTGLEQMLAALPNGGLGAEVELYGADPAARNFLPTVAARTGLRPYELLCRMNPRIPRVAVEAATPLGRVEQATFRLAVRAAPDVP